MELQNTYYDKLKPVVDSVIGALEDGKVTMAEVWTFLIILSDSMRVILTEVADLSEDDLAALKAASNQLYDDYVLPLDLPGPDFIIDPLIRNGILPGVVEAAFRLAKERLAVTAPDTAGDDDADDDADTGAD